MREKFITASVGLLAFVVSLMALGSIALAADKGNVIDSKHDLSAGGAPVCENCHVPHDASGDFLWARTPSTNGGQFSGLKTFCYSCHDGVVAGEQYVFSTSTFSHEVKPLASGQSLSGEDCDRCHDPHDNSKTKFLTVTAGANVCANASPCHGTKEGHRDHPVNSPTDLPLLRSWDPAAIPPVVGTRLWDTTGTSVVASGPADMKCETCHSPHGALTKKLNTMTMAGSALCTNCHDY
jgi:predicted CXXCH cytochrome family protein